MCPATLTLAFFPGAAGTELDDILHEGACFCGIRATDVSAVERPTWQIMKQPARGVRNVPVAS